MSSHSACLESGSICLNKLFGRSRPSSCCKSWSGRNEVENFSIPKRETYSIQTRATSPTHPRDLCCWRCLACEASYHRESDTSERSVADSRTLKLRYKPVRGPENPEPKVPEHAQGSKYPKLSMAHEPFLNIQYAPYEGLEFRV